jgi:flagellar assembly protein FliH
MPAMAGPVIVSRNRSTSATHLTESQAAAREQAYEDARRAGFEQGFSDGQAQREALQQAAKRFAAAVDQAARPLQQLEELLLDEIAQLALSIGKQLARRELRIDPAQVAAIVRETIALLPANSRGVRVYLHPRDAAVLRDTLSPAAESSAWQLLEDPVMTTGGCRVESEFARIDARFESRVAAIVATLLEETSESPDV